MCPVQCVTCVSGRSCYLCLRPLISGRSVTYVSGRSELSLQFFVPRNRRVTSPPRKTKTTRFDGNQNHAKIIRKVALDIKKKTNIDFGKTSQRRLMLDTLPYRPYIGSIRYRLVLRYTRGFSD